MTQMRMLHWNGLASLLAAAALIGCSDVPTQSAATETASRTPAGAQTLVAITCSASIATKSVKCDEPGAGGALRDVIIGGQNVYVTLTAGAVSDVPADCPNAVNPAPAMSCYSFNVTVKNLIPQPIGTIDGVNTTAEGVRVFFQTPPSSTGTGTMTVSNYDGLGFFTASGQPYFQYYTRLYEGQTSNAVNWQFQHTPDVTSFTFTVYVSAAVIWPDGYVADLPAVLALNPGESFTLTGTARDYLDRVVPGQAISYTSSNPALVSVNGSILTAGATVGVDTVTALSGVRPSAIPPVVAVCPAVNVAIPSSTSAALDGSDCRTALFRDINGTQAFLPSTDFYGDLYRVSLTAGQTVQITMNTANVFNARLVLADRTGHMVANAVNDGLGDSQISFTPATSGVYVIQATTFSPNFTGAYTLDVTP